MAVINVNTSATRIFGEMNHCWVKVEDGNIFIKPTNRSVTGVTTGGETGKIVDVIRKFKKDIDGNKRLNGIRLVSDLELPVGAKFEIVPDAYSWYALIPAKKVYPSVAGASISAFLDVFSHPVEVAPKKKRGRPAKQKMAVAA